MQIFHNPNYNFIRWRWHAIALSAAIIIAGGVLMATVGMQLGIDFSGGTLVRVRFEQQVTEDQVRSALSSIPGDKVVQQFGPAADREIMIRLPQTSTAEQGASLEQGSRQIEEALQKAGLPKFEVVLRDIREKVTQGATFADALAHHPGYFEPLYVNMVKAGEAAGNLDVILARLADFMQKEARVRAKVKAALAYPIVCRSKFSRMLSACSSTGPWLPKPCL